MVAIIKAPGLFIHTGEKEGRVWYRIDISNQKRIDGEWKLPDGVTEQFTSKFYNEAQFKALVADMSKHLNGGE